MEVVRFPCRKNAQVVSGVVPHLPQQGGIDGIAQVGKAEHHRLVSGPSPVRPHRKRTPIIRGRGLYLQALYGKAG